MTTIASRSEVHALYDITLHLCWYTIISNLRKITVFPDYLVFAQQQAIPKDFTAFPSTSSYRLVFVLLN